MKKRKKKNHLKVLLWHHKHFLLVSKVLLLKYNILQLVLYSQKMHLLQPNHYVFLEFEDLSNEHFIFYYFFIIEPKKKKKKKKLEEHLWLIKDKIVNMDLKVFYNEQHFGNGIMHLQNLSLQMLIVRE